MKSPRIQYVVCPVCDGKTRMCNRCVGKGIVPAGDGWNFMPKEQPRFCVSCGNRVTLNRTAWLNTNQEWSRCRNCWPRTITFQPCGCAYCLTVEAAIDDAKEAHRGTQAA